MRMLEHSKPSQKTNSLVSKALCGGTHCDKESKKCLQFFHRQLRPSGRVFILNLQCVGGISICFSQYILKYPITHKE